MTSWGGRSLLTTRYLALAFAGGVLLLALGGVLLASTATYPLAGVVGLGLLVLGTGAAATVVLEPRWDARRPGSRLSTDPTGTPSTLVACAAWTGVMRWAGALALAVPLLVVALGSLVQAQWVVAAVCGVLVLLVVRLLAPTVTPEGVHLSARGITVRHHGRPLQVDWDDMAELAVATWMVVHTVDGRRVRLTFRQLAVGVEQLASALVRSARDADARLALGTAASLDPRLWGLGA